MVTWMVFVTRPLFDRGKSCNMSTVMANYTVKFVYALVFKLGYPPLKLLCDTLKLNLGLRLVLFARYGIKGCSRV